MSVQVKSNNAYAGGNTLLTAAQVARAASDIYALYSARVTADGGTIQDATGCLTAITAALAKGYYYSIAAAISARWGIKVSGPNITKFYNLADPSSNPVDGVVTGTLPLDTTTLAWATALWSSGATVAFASLVINKAGKLGYVAASHRATNTIGLFLSGTPVAQPWSFNEYSGNALVNSVSQTNTFSSGYALTNEDSVGFFCDQSTSPNPTWTAFLNGCEKKQQSQAITTLANNASATMTLARSGSANVWLDEMWLHNAATYDVIANCNFDVGNRY